MPVSGNEDPAVASDLWKKCFVGRADICGDVLLVDAIANTGSIELVYDFRAIPVFIKVESEIRQPSS
jgi:hypothetical protein